MNTNFSAATLLQQGNDELDRGQYKIALATFQEAAALEPQNHQILYAIGLAYYRLDRYQEAIEPLNQALAIQPDYTLALARRGIVYQELNQRELAQADFERAIQITPQDYEGWRGRGDAFDELKRYEEAIADYDKAIALNPDDHIVYYNRGISLNNLGRYEEAIADYNQAIALNPDYHIAYNNRGNSMGNLGRYEEAIADFNQAIEIKPDAWQPKFNLGIAHYNCGEQQANPFADWFKAKASYEQALKYLTDQNLHQEYLEVLQRLIKVCRYLLPAPQVEELWKKGADQLGQWLQNPNLSLGQRITLERKFASFNQVRVDALANSNNPENQLKALELAEQRKNTCIAWLHQQNSNEADKLPYAEMQKLLQARTAAIYWHVSPAGITTFIIKHNQSPQIFTPSPAPQSRQVSLQTQAYPPHAYQFQQFQTWMQEWQQSYRDYHQGNFPPEIVAKENAPWRQNINVMLYTKLRNLLETNRLIREHLQDIDRLILIPHRELHLLPLHILFPGRFTTTYLPSFQVGLNLKLIQPNPHQKSLLNVENSLNELPFTAIESIAISACHSQNSTLTNTTPTELLQQLTSNSGYFHFAGHAAHEPEEPRASALDLGNSEKLTLGDIFDQKLDFNQYQLICLSACETGITSNQSLLDEYVGFVSGFLAKGSQYVVSTLWTVDERSAALLMIEFYQKLSQLTPPLALKEAQEWLRSVTYEKLAQWYRQLAAALREQAAKNSAIPHCCAYLETEAQIILDDSVKMESSEPPFQSPYHWAGFTIHGNLT
jgi:CHAT domain-containing protein/Flp pilus assembly protein TadD